MQLLVQRFIRFLLCRAPRTALIDEPMLRYRGAADFSFRTTLRDGLEIAVSNFFVSIFYPETSPIRDVGQFFGVVRQERRGFNGKRAGDEAIMKPRIWIDFIHHESLKLLFRRLQDQGRVRSFLLAVLFVSHLLVRA